MANPRANRRDEQAKAFARRYVKHFDAARAARESGYTGGRANAAGYRYLAKPETQRELARLMREAQRRTEASLECTLSELAAIGYSDMRNYFTLEDGALELRDFDELTGAEAAAIRGVEITERTFGDITERRVKLQLWDKPRALTALLGCHGLLADFLAHVSEKRAIDVTPEGPAVSEYTKLLGEQAREVDRFIDTLDAPSEDDVIQ